MDAKYAEELGNMEGEKEDFNKTQNQTSDSRWWRSGKTEIECLLTEHQKNGCNFTDRMLEHEWFASEGCLPHFLCYRNFLAFYKFFYALAFPPKFLTRAPQKFTIPLLYFKQLTPSPGLFYLSFFLILFLPITLSPLTGAFFRFLYFTYSLALS